MNYYRLEQGGLVPPPVCGVSADGRALTNFRARVQQSAAFAAQNGYFPVAEKQPAEPPARAGYRTELHWGLVDGCWQCSYVQSPISDEPLS